MGKRKGIAAAVVQAMKLALGQHHDYANLEAPEGEVLAETKGTPYPMGRHWFRQIGRLVKGADGRKSHVVVLEKMKRAPAMSKLLKAAV